MWPIRDATNRDQAQVFTLHIQGLKESGSLSSDTSLDVDLEDIEASYPKPYSRFIVVEGEQGEIIGMGALRPYDESTVELKRMRVSSAYRRQGVAQQILSTLIEYAASLSDVTQIILDTSQDQIAAQRLYEKNGFKKAGNAMVSDIKSFIYKKNIK